MFYSKHELKIFIFNWREFQSSKKKKNLNIFKIQEVLQNDIICLMRIRKDDYSQINKINI